MAHKFVLRKWKHGGFVLDDSIWSKRKIKFMTPLGQGHELSKSLKGLRERDEVILIFKK